MPTFSKKPLAAIVVLLNLLPASNLLANEFSLTDDLITVDGIGTVALASNGALANISATINDPVPANIPDINFTLINNNTQSGQYDVRLGLIIQQQGSSRRLESIMGVVRVTVDGTGSITAVDVLNSEPLSVKIRQDGITVTYTNAADIGVIQTSGANVTVSASAINNALASSNADIADMVNALTLSGHYNYRIAMQPVAGEFSVGTVDDDSDFVALARMQSSCELDNASTSGANFILGDAASFNAAYAVHGVLSLGGATSPSAGFSPLTEDCDTAPGPVEPLPIQAVTNANENAAAGLARAQAAIDSRNPNAAKNEARDAVDNLKDALVQLKQQRADDGSANQTQLMALTSTFISLGQTIQAAVALPGAPVFDEIDELNSDMQDLMTLLLDKKDTLSVSDKNSIQDAVLQTLAANGLQSSDQDDESTQRRNKAALQQVLNAQAELDIQVSAEQVSEQRNLNSRYQANNSNGGSRPEQFLFGPAANVSSNFLGNRLGSNRVDTGPINSALTASNAVNSNALLSSVLNTDAANQSELSIPAQPGAIVDSDGLITLRTEDNRAFRYQFTGVAFVPEQALANGIYNAPNGALYSVDNGVIVEFAAAPANLQTFNAAVAALGYSASTEGPGLVNISLDNGERLSAAFRFEDLVNATGECSTITFAAPSGQPTSADFVFTAQCNNGVTQTLVPVVLEQALYDTIINSGLNIRNSRDTGYLQVDGVGAFRPDFFVYPLTLEDEVFLNSNAYLEGVALQGGDFNGDGRTDYRVLSARGKQTLWGL